MRFPWLGAARVLLAITVALASRIAMAQVSADPPRMVGHLSVEQGLSQSSVTCVYQDRRGFLWIGTQDGLNRYDGSRFTVYRTDSRDATSISDSYVTRIVEDANGRLWLGTQTGGLNLFDPATGRFARFGQNLEGTRHFGSTGILALALAQNGDVWLGTWGGGLSRFRPGTGAITTYVHDAGDPDSLANKNVWAVAVDHAGVVWAGSFGGLNQIDPTTGRMTLVRRAPGDASFDFTGVNVSALHEDAAGTLWVGTWGKGLVAIDRDRRSTRVFPPNAGQPGAMADGRIWSLAEDAQHHLWVGTEKDGLYEFDGQRFVPQLRPGQGPGSPDALTGISALAVDRTGIVWAGSSGTGLYKILPPLKAFWRLAHVPHEAASLPGSNVWAIHEDRRGALWVGTMGSGLAVRDPETGRFSRVALDASPARPSGTAESVVSIVEDRAGRLLVSADTDGLYRADPVTRRLVRFPEAPAERAKLEGVRMMSLWVDEDGTAWLGSLGRGLYRVDARGSVTHFEAEPKNPDALASNSILAIRRTRDGVLWLGTQADGLEAFANGRFLHYRAVPGRRDGLTDNRIGALYEDASGVLWIGTWGGGLNRLASDRRTFAAYTQREGLPNDMIYGIVDDTDGHLWLSTNNGICRFTMASGETRNFSTSDGLLDREFNQGAFHRGGSGRLYFGGVNGVTAFAPGAIRDNLQPPPLALTSFARRNAPVLDGLCLPSNRDIDLRPGENSFDLEFAALDFSSPERNQFQYRLEGLEDEWSGPSTRSFVSYTKVPPGRYVLHVRGSNGDGVWNQAGLSIPIVVHAPWWATRWAYAGYAICVVASLGLVSWRRSVVHRHTLARQQAELEHERQVSDSLRKAELALRASEERFRRFMEWLPGVGFIKDADSRAVYVNRQFEQVLGFQNEQILGKRDDEYLPLDVASQTMAADRRVVETREAIEYVDEIPFPDGVRYFRTAKFPIFDEAGGVAFIGGVAIDITDKKQLEQQLLLAQRLEGIGTLAGGIAHDFNNLLTIINGYTALLRGGTTDRDDAARCMSAIEQAVQRGASLVRQILTFAQRSDVSFRPLDIDVLVGELASMVGETFPKTIRVVHAPGEPMPLLHADHSQIHQALLNLAVNARDAMPNGGTLTFATSLVPADQMRGRFPGTIDGSYVCVAVTDTGTGMDEAAQARAFEPFFTTKGPGRGTGLGLAVVYGVAQVHNGFAQIESAVGTGTTVRLFFPSSAAPAEVETGEKANLDKSETGVGTLLVIEDETLVASLLQRVLERAGYSVLLARDGQEGIEMFTQHRHAIDLVLMDFGLPKRPGDEVFDEIRAIDPHARVVIASGNLDGAIRSRLEAGGLLGFLQKPYSNQAVLETIRSILANLT